MRRAVLGVLVGLGPVLVSFLVVVVSLLVVVVSLLVVVVSLLVVVVYCMVLSFGWRCEEYWHRTLSGEWVRTGCRMLFEAVCASEVGGVSLYADEDI